MRNLRHMGLLAGASLVSLLLASPGLGRAGDPAPAAVSAQTVAPSQPWAHAASDVPADPSIRYGTLPNGVRYAIQQNKTPPGAASVWVRIDAGSLHEKDDQRGLAHFMEHMAFNGTKEIPKNELIHRLERLGLQFGADLNAGTGLDRTFYRLEMSRVDGMKLDTALHILRQQVSAATMDSQAIDDERGVIAGEERLRNSPTTKIGEKQLEIMAAGTRLPKRNPIGDMEIIRTAPRERFVDYYRTWYRPSRATVIAVGDFDVDAMEARIRKNFADWQPAGPDGVEPDLGKLEPHKQQAYVYSDPSLSPGISVTWVNPPELKPDTMANRREAWVNGLAIAVLNRRLDEMTRAENPPFVTVAASTQEAIRSLSVAGLQASYLPGKWREALAAIEQAQRQFAEYGISDAELQREINSKRTAYENGAKAASTRNSIMLAMSMENDVNERRVTTSPATDLAIFEAAVKDISAAEVSAAAKKMFTGGGPIITLMTTEPVEGGDATLASAYEASRQVAVARLEPSVQKAWAYTDFGTAGKVVSTGKPDMFGAITVTFENGVILRFKHADYNKEAVSINILTGIGDRNFSPDRFDPRRTAIGGLVGGGLGKMTLDEAYRSLNGKVVGASLSTMGQRFVISGGTIPKDLDLEMQYLAAFVSDAAYRSAPFEVAIANASTGWSLAQIAPETVFAVQVKPILAGNDKRAELVPPDVMKDWRMDDLRPDVKAMLDAGPLEIAIVGDTTLDKAVKSVASTFGALPRRAPYNAPAPNADVRRFPAPNMKPAEFKHKGLASQALGSVTWHTIDAVDGLRASRQMQVLKAVLQLRVLDVIREKEALAYSPRVNDEYSSDYRGYGFVTVSANTVPAKLPAFYAAVDGIVKSLQEKPITADELKRARQPMIEHVRKYIDTNEFWSSAVVTSFYQPALAREALNGEADYMSVTPAMIQELARKYLQVDQAYRASVVPAKADSPSS